LLHKVSPTTVDASRCSTTSHRPRCRRTLLSPFPTERSTCTLSPMQNLSITTPLRAVSQGTTPSSPCHYQRTASHFSASSWSPAFSLGIACGWTRTTMGSRTKVSRAYLGLSSTCLTTRQVPWCSSPPSRRTQTGPISFRNPTPCLNWEVSMWSALIPTSPHSRAWR
jgi:hypothetical protein